MIHITLEGRPISTQHLYLKNHHWVFMSNKGRALKQSYIEQIRSQYKWEVIYKNVSIAIDLFFQDKRPRDWDNWHKISMDALEWIVLYNDRQIQKALVRKHIDKDNPRIEIYIDYETPNFNNKVEKNDLRKNKQEMNQ